MSNPKKNLAMGGVAVVCLMGGLLLIWSFAHASAPDPATAEPTELVTYILSEDFGQLPAEQRKRYLTLAMQRVSEMTDEQAAQLREMMKEWKQNKPKELKQAVVALFKNMMVSEARQYVQVPAEKRDQWLEQRIPQWMAMMPKRSAEQRAADEANLTEEQKKRREARRKGKDPRSQEEKLRDFQDNAMQMTTAEERSLIMGLMQDASPKMRVHFEKRRAAESKKAP